MRNFLLIYLSSLLSGHLISQNLNIAQHDGVDQTSELVSINSKSYYLRVSYRDCNFSEAFLVCLNDSGRVIAKHPLGVYPLNYIGKIIKTKDNALLFNGTSGGSYDAGPNSGYIIKMDTNGTVLFQNLNLGSGLFPKISGISQHPDSSYYLLNGNGISHLSKSGQSIPFTGPLTAQNGAIWAMANGNILMNGVLNSVRSNMLLDTNGNVLNQQACPNKIVKYIERQNYILALTSTGIIEKYSLNLGLQSSSTLAINPLTYQIKDFTMRHDSIFLCGSSSTNQNPFYAILDSNFNIKYQTTSILKGVKPSGISLTNKNAVHIVAMSFSKSSPFHTYTSVFRLNLIGVFNSGSDIGITGISNLNTRLFTSGWTIPYLEMDVTVKNFGTDTVKGFYVNHYGVQGGISLCYFLLHKKVQTPLAPGATLTVPTGSFYGQPFTVSQASTTINPIKWNLCIFTSVPNSKNDLDTDNDAYCDTLLLTTVGLEGNNLMQEQVRIFPNPFDEEIRMSSDLEIKSVQIINALGQLMYEAQIEAKEWQFNLRNLNSGIYFLKIETEKETVSRRLIKN